MYSEKFKITIHGATILMHNAQTADPLNPYSKELRKFTNKRGQQPDSHHEEIAELEFVAGMYYRDDIGPYIPSLNVKSMLIQGARKSRKGKDFAMVDVLEDEIPLRYEGPRDLESLKKDRNFRLTVSVGIGPRRIVRTRPLFRDWSATFNVGIFSGSSVSGDDLEQALEESSRKIGLGDWRPEKGGIHGRFVIEEFKKLAK